MSQRTSVGIRMYACVWYIRVPFTVTSAMHTWRQHSNTNNVNLSLKMAQRRRAEQRHLSGIPPVSMCVLNVHVRMCTQRALMNHSVAHRLHLHMCAHACSMEFVESQRMLVDVLRNVCHHLGMADSSRHVTH